MGIFGALTTAVTGMRAQSFALENISGNIANSQTTAFKRIDTSFVDLIPDAAAITAAFRQRHRQFAHDQHRAGRHPVDLDRHLHGDQRRWLLRRPRSRRASSTTSPVFDGIDNYTRRGDFQPDKNGYLVNGAGYYLMGIPVDATTGNLVGSVPQLLQVPERLPARAADDRRSTIAPISRAIRCTPATTPTCPVRNCSIRPISRPIRLPAPRQPAKITGTGATLSADAVAVTDGHSRLVGTLARAAATLSSTEPRRSRSAPADNLADRHQ